MVHLVVSFSTLLFCWCIWTVRGSIEYEQYIRNKSFVFISGWPQSGTSLVNQILNLHPRISTMVQKCEEIIGSRCTNFNHEGQWMLSLSARSYLNAGAMCPTTEKISDPEKNAVLSEWKQFWSMDKAIFVEKSPQSLVKIPLLRKIFTGAASVKFLVVLKHPVTLNIATPRGYSYTTGKYRDKQSHTSPGVSYKLGPSQVRFVLQHFAEMMDHDNTTMYLPRDKYCSVGWMQAMHNLHKVLQQPYTSSSSTSSDPAATGKNSSEHLVADLELDSAAPLIPVPTQSEGSSPLRPANDIRILRYEMFSQPLAVCLRLFHFIFEVENASTEHQKDINRMICEHYFTPKALLAQKQMDQQRQQKEQSSQHSSLDVLNGHSRQDNRLATHTSDLMYRHKPNHRRHLAYTVQHAHIKQTNSTGHSNNMSATVRSFSPPRTSTTTTRRRRRRRRRTTTTTTTNATRQLRMRLGVGSDKYNSNNNNNHISFVFRPDLVVNEARDRMKDFSMAYQQLVSSLPPAAALASNPQQQQQLKAKLDRIQHTMNEFGYNLLKWPHNGRDMHQSLFSKWELI